MRYEIKNETSPSYVDIFPGIVEAYQFSPCEYDQFFAQEAQKPEHLRQRSCLLVCHCQKCQQRLIS